MNDSPSAQTDPQDRYSRQVLYERMGPEGQAKLAAARVTLVGCGGLGSMMADTLVRAGVGRLRICDRDYPKLDNLQRQVLFDENDVAANLPKAEAARIKLRRINSQVTVEAVVADVNHTNIERHTRDCDLLLDGTDNFETRYLINDLAVKQSLPWVYGGVIGTTGLCLPIIPGETPCLRCVLETPPPPEMTPTCDVVGVLAPAVSVVAALECIEAIKILTGRLGDLNRFLFSIDVWTGRWVEVNVAGAREKGDCPCCKQQRFEYLERDTPAAAAHLCGRDAVQIHRSGAKRPDLAAVAARLEPVSQGPVTYNRFLLRARVDDCELTLFANGRAIITGTDNIDRARAVYDKYVGG